MEDKSLADIALMCECAEKLSRFSILVDFLKKAMTHYYTHKSNKTKITADDRKILEKKYEELKDFLKDCEFY